MTQEKKRILFVGEASFLNTGFSTYYRELLPRLAETGKYIIGEFGSYASQHDPRVESFIAGRWKFYGNNPVNEQEKAIYDQADDPHQPGQNTNQFGKYKFEAVCADFRPDIVIDIRDWWMCLLQGTNIFTTDGIKDVSEVEVDDFVLTEDGNFNRVKETFARNYRGVTHKIIPTHCKLPVHVTDKHPILAYIRPNKNWKNGGGWPNFQNIQPEWIIPEKLNKGDFVCYPIPTIEKDGSKPISNQLARLIGYYAAEGCLMYEGAKKNNRLKGVQFTFGTSNVERSYVEEVIAAIKEEYGLDATIKMVNHSYIVVRAFGKKIAKDMHDFVPGTASTKRVSRAILESPKEVVANFLCGLFRGDGCINTSTERGSYNTASVNLAYDVFYMCVKLGFVPSFNLNKNSLNGKSYQRYIFSFVGYNHKVYKRFALIYNQGQYLCKRDYTMSNDQYVFMSIDKIERDEGETIVYNMEVDKNQSYTSSFIMHNCAYQQRSPFREYFKWLLMPTVDSIPQREEWIETYHTADYIMAYSDFGVDALRKSSPKLEVKFNPNNVKVVGKETRRIPGKTHPIPLRPGVDLETFRPMDKRDLRLQWGVNPNNPIILIVQRNQARKRLAEAIQAFAYMKTKYGSSDPKNPNEVDKAVMLLHTSWPDNMMSCDYPRVIQRTAYGYHGMPYKHKKIMSEVLNTYLCNNCGASFLGAAVRLAEANQHNNFSLECPHCKQVTVRAPNTGAGFDRDKLAEIYAMSDILLQMSIAEGCGMPVQEAKACGTMVLATDYAAIAEKGSVPPYEHIDQNDYDVCLGGDKLDVAYLYEEPETRCWRAHTCIESAGDSMAAYLLDEELLREKQKQARQCAEKHYDWDKNWKEWEFILDRVSIKDRSKTWDKPAEVLDIISKKCPDGLDDEAFVDWCYTELLNQDVDPKGKQDWLGTIQGHMSQGASHEEARANVEQFFRNLVDSNNKIEEMRSRHLVPEEEEDPNKIKVVLI